MLAGSPALTPAQQAANLAIFAINALINATHVPTSEHVGSIGTYGSANHNPGGTISVRVYIPDYLQAALTKIDAQALFSIMSSEGPAVGSTF